MCMEDVILGRHTATNESVIPIGKTVIPVVDYDKYRTVLMFMPPESGYITVSLNPNTAQNLGTIIQSTGVPVILNIQEVGDLVMKAWYAVSSVNGNMMTLYEGHLHKD